MERTGKHNNAKERMLESQKKFLYKNLNKESKQNYIITVSNEEQISKTT